MSKHTPHTVLVTVYDSAVTEYGITWQTEAAGSPAVDYTDPADVTFSHAVRVSGETFESTETVGNRAKIPVPHGSAVLWRCGDAVTGEFTSPTLLRGVCDEKVDFLVFSDTQDTYNDGRWWAPCFADAEREFPDARFAAHLGDFVQIGASGNDWKKMTDSCAEYLASCPLAPISGNHEYWPGYTGGVPGITEKHAYVSLPPQDTSYGMYYAFDIGDVHFLALNTGDANETGGKGLTRSQVEYIKHDLESCRKKWKIVLTHNPLYSPGKYGARYPIFGMALGMRRQLDGLFARTGVDLVLCAHDHVLSLTYPILDNGVPEDDCPRDGEYFVSPHGPLHLQIGPTGGQDRDIEKPLGREFARMFDVARAMPEDIVAYAGVSVDGDRLTVDWRLVDPISGELYEKIRFGIIK